MTEPPGHHPARGDNILLLGKGWYPDEIGGLDRYFRGLLEALPGATGIVEGPITAGNRQAVAGGDTDDPTSIRLIRFARAARRHGRRATVVDSHFALTAFLPRLLFLRGRVHITHFQGPWAYESAYETSTTGLSFWGRRALERFVYRRADAVVTLTHAFKRVAVEKYGLRPWDVHVLHPTVDVGDFTPGDRADERARLGVAPNEFVAVCVRRLVPRTGVDDLLDAWKAVESKTSRRLFVAGDGQLRARIEARVAAEPGLESVSVLGRISDGALISLYRAADLNIVPTRAWEGFGLTVKEAAACGTPSVVTDVGGLPEAAAELGRDLVVPPQDPDALAARISRAIAGDLPAREVVRRTVATRTWADVATEHLSLYESVCRRRSGATSHRPRVLYLDHTAALSGGELALLRTLAAEESRVESHVILGAHGPLAERLTSAGVSVEVSPLSRGAQDMRKDAVGLRTSGVVAAVQTLTHSIRLAARIRKIRPDVVHCNSLKSGVYGSIAARLAGVPVVWHVHDRISTDYLPARVVPVLRLIMRRLPNALLTNSENVAATIGELERIRIVPNPVQIGLGDAGPSDRPTTFGVVGRIAQWKGQDVFLRAFARTYAGAGVRARIIGSPLFGEEPYAARLVDLAAELGVADQVDFVGFKDDIGAEFAKLDVLVHCSVIPEPFGQVITEAFAAGIPVIAADAGGPAELITSGVNGLLTRPGDVESLGLAMQQLGASTALRARLAEEGLRSAKQFTPLATWAVLDSVYRGLAARAFSCDPPVASDGATVAP